MECVVLLRRTNKVTLGVSDRISLTNKMWLFAHFNEHTMAAFLLKCMEESTTHPIPHKLNP